MPSPWRPRRPSACLRCSSACCRGISQRWGEPASSENLRLPLCQFCVCYHPTRGQQGVNDVPEAAVEAIQRRLAAILATDVVGYSRLVEKDETATLAAIRALRATVIDPLVAKHRGRTVKLMGDGAIIEFGSVVDAVSCAIS